MGKRLFWIGLIGLGVSLLVLVVALIVPLVSGGRSSWGESLVAIIPAGVLAVVCLILTFIGLFGMQQEQLDRYRSRYDDEEDEPCRRRRRDEDDDDDDDRPRRRRNRDDD